MTTGQTTDTIKTTTLVKNKLHVYCEYDIINTQYIYIYLYIRKVYSKIYNTYIQYMKIQNNTDLRYGF